MDDRDDLTRLMNIGPRSAGWLKDVGIQTPADLIDVGPAEAFCRVRAEGHSPSLNLLWALAGAIHEIPWEHLPAELKNELLEAVNQQDPPSPTSGPSF